MIRYAVSMGSFGQGFMTPALADAFRQSKLHNVEMTFYSCIMKDEDNTVRSRRLCEELIAEGVIRPVSVHLPFHGGMGPWDPSEPEEGIRRTVGEKLIRLIRENRSQMAPQVTLHASLEPSFEEHPIRLDQACRTIEQLIPVAEELDFSINVELLPRTCLGGCVEELQQITGCFDAKHVGICFDVNHAMNRYRELPAMIAELEPRIRTFHISDYDGIDETHWIPGQGIIDWPTVMESIRTISHDVVLILETTNQLGGILRNRELNPIFGMRHLEHACWFLENCDRLVPESAAFRIPGN